MQGHVKFVDCRIDFCREALGSFVPSFPSPRTRLMSPDIASSFAFFAGSFISLMLSFRFAAAHLAQQQEIVRRGLASTGRVVHVWRPWLMGSFARIYFEYEPVPGTQPIRCCHVDRRSQGDVQSSLPAVGTVVGIRYLPENPARAVIAKLVSRLRP